MKRFICIAKCPELNFDKETHCIFTEKEIEDKKEYDLETCPCGNKTILKEIK